MKKMKIEVSMGEFADRYSIASIRCEKGLGDISEEWRCALLDLPDATRRWYRRLRRINHDLWDLEEQSFDPVRAKEIRRLNRARARLKMKIDEGIGSELRERKSAGWMRN